MLIDFLKVMLIQDLVWTQAKVISSNQQTFPCIFSRGSKHTPVFKNNPSI